MDHRRRLLGRAVGQHQPRGRVLRDAPHAVHVRGKAQTGQITQGLMLHLAYLFATIGLVQGLKLMGDPAKAKQGNLLAAASVVLALVALILATGWTTPVNLILLLVLLAAGSVIGNIWSNRVAMTAMPQLVSIFNGLGGACA